MVKYGLIDPYEISDVIWYPQWKEYRNIHWYKRLGRKEFLDIGESIKAANKIFHPVLLYSCERHTGIFWGGSRIYWARQYNIPLPAIVSDHNNNYSLPEIGLQDVYRMLPREHLIVDKLGIYPTNHQDLGKAMAKWRDKTSGGIIDLHDRETPSMINHPAYERVEEEIKKKEPIKEKKSRKAV